MNDSLTHHCLFVLLACLLLWSSVLKHTVDQADGAAHVERAIRSQRHALVQKLTKRIDELNAHTRDYRLLLRPLVAFPTDEQGVPMPAKLLLL
jgi:hypothetical protein